MTVKQKGQQPSFAGIVVTAASRDQAVRNYASVAQQQDLEVLSSADGSFMLATLAGSHNSFLNPLSADKEKMKVMDVEIESNSSDAEDVVSVHYTMCSECSSHIIADSCESVSHCPSCHADVDFDRELDTEMESDSSADVEMQGAQGIVVTAGSFEEAQRQFVELLASAEHGTEFVDSDNNVSFVSNSASEINYSPFHGSEVNQSDLGSESSADLEALASDFEGEANYYQCIDTDDCGMHVLSSSDDVTLCPSCSSALVDPEDMEEIEQSVLAMDADLDDDEDFDDDDDLLDDDDDLYDEDADMDEEMDDDFEIVSSSDEDDEDEDDEDDEDFEDEEDDEDDDIDGLEDEEDEDEEDEDEDVESESSALVAATVNVQSLVSKSSGGLDPKAVALVNCSTVAGENRWIAFHNETPIAVASESNVEGTIKDVFTTSNFSNAALRSIAANGVEKGLEEFGFKAIAFDDETVEVAVSQQIVDDAQAKIESYDNAQRDRDSKLMERMGAALATSLMGLNRGVFTGKTNPLIESLASALQAAGIRNGRELVDNVFEANADNFNRLIVEQTTNLLGKSPETQNEIGEMVASSSYARKDGVASVSQTVESRLQPRTVQQPVQQTQEDLSSKSSASNAKDRFRSVLGRI